MRIISVLILLSFITLFLSCDKKGDNKTIKLEAKHRIFDYADLVTTDQEDSLFLLIQTLENEIGSQIVIVTIFSLEGQRIEEYSLKMFEDLGVGRANIDDGILITVVEADRMVRIDVGYGLEKIIRDEIASRIIREEMAPRFRENDYAGGLAQGVAKIIQLIRENKELVGQRL